MLQTFNCELFSSKECDTLVEYFKSMSATINSGTNINPTYDGRILNADDCDTVIRTLLYTKSIEVATMVSKFYGENTVYPETIHVVSWGAGTSLGTHADNFFIEQDKPNYSPNRNYSATFVLTEDFEGGEFYFDYKGKKFIMPTRKGWGNVFGAGPEYPHGVQEVTSGHRYTVAIWFTKDYQHSIYNRTPSPVTKSSGKTGTETSKTIPFVLPE